MVKWPEEREREREREKERETENVGQMAIARKGNLGGCDPMFF
jgi:hypothetical protein